MYHCSSQRGVNTMSQKTRGKKKISIIKIIEYLRFSPEINTRTKKSKHFGRIKHIPKLYLVQCKQLAVIKKKKKKNCSKNFLLTPTKIIHCNKAVKKHTKHKDGTNKIDVVFQDKEIGVCVCVLLLVRH